MVVVVVEFATLAAKYNLFGVFDLDLTPTLMHCD
jgi:hypothetical protein